MQPKHTITCSRCKKKLGTTPTRLNDLIAKAGSLKALEAAYTCRECKRGAKPAPVAGALPANKIKCSKCGELVGSPPDRIAKLAKEGKLGGYTCRSCKKGTPNVNGKPKKLTKSKISCSRCGEKFGTTPDRLKRLIGQFGSIEDVHAKYVCRKCRKAHNLYKDGRLKPEKRKRAKCHYTVDAAGECVLPDYMKSWRRKNHVDDVCGSWHGLAFKPKNVKESVMIHSVIKEVMDKAFKK